MITAKLQLLKDTFESKFDTDKFKRFTREFFNEPEMLSAKRHTGIWKEYEQHILSYSDIAKFKDAGGNKIIVFTVELKNEKGAERARSLQRNFISKILDKQNCEAAIVAFYSDNDVNWRLSFVRLDYTFKDKGLELDLTPARRYSYLVGGNETSHTAQKQLYPLFEDDKHNPTIDTIEAAFSVEKVTKDFFEQYKSKYIDLKEYLEAYEPFINETSNLGFEISKFAEQFAKKLMGQLAFLYFLQKKGWLGVRIMPENHTLTEVQFKEIYIRQEDSLHKAVLDKFFPASKTGNRKLNIRLFHSIADEEAELLSDCLIDSDFNMPWGSGNQKFIREIFDFCVERTNFNFFDEYLEPFFYEALNKKRKNQYFKKFNCKIPFLNGGLFEPLEGYHWKNMKFNIPHEIFSNKKIKGKEADGILDIFDRFNFTINEDEPLEKEVAVDPEMLGKIFENLLDVKDRKSKGAFYTPREIVHYMCQESLSNYLVNETGVPYDDIKQFILYGELIKDADNRTNVGYGKEFTIKQTVFDKIVEIENALKNIKVADPAVGSGAFPLGMLNEIVRARNNITEYLIHKDKQGAFGKKYGEVHIRKARSYYKIKRDTIQNSIFAVDIEPSAVDIAKLRLWLSVVVEQEINKETPEPQPLPNLDCNIMVGNSLIDEYEGIKLFDESILYKNKTKGNNESEAYKEIASAMQMSLLIDNSDDMLKEMFDLQDRYFSEDDEKKKKDIKAKIDKCREDLIEYKLTLDGNKEALKKYKELQQNKIKPFFLWQLEFAKVFKEKGGFDVVIGNPPYFNVQTLGAKNKLVDYFKREFSKIWMDKSDILFYFIFKSCQISNSQVNFITSNAFLFSDKAKKLRNYIVDYMPIEKIVNFEKHMVFGSASITSCICFFNKLNKCESTKALVFKDKVENMQLELWQEKSMFNVVLKKDSVFALTPERITKLNDKIDANHSQLSNLVKVGKGMETAANQVFTFSTLPPFPDEYIKKRMSGEIINRYFTSNPFEYLLYFEHVNIFEELDQSVKNHLLENREILENRATVKNEGREWWKYSRPLHKEFYHLNKLWCSYRGKNNCFAYDDTKQCIGFTNTTVIFDTNPEIDLKYLLALLNSTTLNFRYKSIGKQTGGGVYEYFENGIGKLPIPNILKNDQQLFVDLANEIISRKNSDPQADNTYFEKQIDKIVYNLYGLNEDEIRIIEEG